uniref:Uncharacterized protein n=1 Tax=Panagrolaimus superbus TaxID=310955 RepID=A0A914YIC7_9BILA
MEINLFLNYYLFFNKIVFGLLSFEFKTVFFVYLRELNLERLNRATVEQLSRHNNLKKLIVHGCRNYEVLQDFHTLPQLLVVKGEIMGLKAMLGDLGDSPEPSPLHHSKQQHQQQQQRQSIESVSTSTSTTASDSESGPLPTATSSATNRDFLGGKSIAVESNY